MAKDETDRTTTVGELVAGLFDAGRHRLVEHELRFRADPTDAEAVHQARVATRRLRSNLRTFRPILDRTVTDPLRVDLRWLGGLLGEVRDAQVLAARLVQLTTDHDLERDGLDDLERLVAGQLELAVANLASALGGDRYHRLLVALAAGARRPPIGRDVRADAKARRATREVVRHRWKQLRRTIDRLGDDPTNLELHEVRKGVKHVRYALQAVKPLGIVGPGLIGSLGRVQDELGELHDAVELRRWIERRRPRLGSAATFLAGQLDQLAAAEAARRRAAFRTAWDAARRIRLE